MILLHEAQTVIINNTDIISTEVCSYYKACNWVLAEDVVAGSDFPPFDKSARDGYALRAEDIHSTLKILETISAGDSPRFEIKKNQCAKIMTGAPVPKGANIVVMHEQTKKTGNSIRILAKPDSSYICYQGEDVKKGELLLKSGTELHPQHIALLAATGKILVKVFNRPQVGVIATGSEIVEPNTVPIRFQIRNSNAYQLMGQLENLGITPDYLGIIKDNKAELEKRIKEAFNFKDVVILTGGVSKGDFDYVPHIIRKSGMHIFFQEVAIQPGKPVIFAKLSNKYCFALSGNPVSSYIQFELLVKPFIKALYGIRTPEIPLKMPLGKEVERKNNEREWFFPVKLGTDGFIYPLRFMGPGHIASFAEANGIASMKIGTNKYCKGELVDVRQI